MQKFMNALINKNFLVLLLSVFSINVLKGIENYNDVIKKHIKQFQQYPTEVMAKWNLLVWTNVLKKEGSSVEIVKEHFPEIFKILEAMYETKMIEKNDFQQLMGFVEETLELFKECNIVDFSGGSYEHSRVALCRLIWMSPVQTYYQRKIQLDCNEELMWRSGLITGSMLVVIIANTAGVIYLLMKSK